LLAHRGILFLESMREGARGAERPSVSLATIALVATLAAFPAMMQADGSVRASGSVEQLG